jgi:hypothetical protein
MLFACGLLTTSTPVLAQTPQATPPAAPAAQPAADKTQNWFQGDVNLLLLGREDVASSKFQEYRVVPKGVSMPVFGVQGSANGNQYALFGSNISQRDQRYTGWLDLSALGVAFDYNQIPHNMGNNGRTLFSETAPGVWNLSGTLRKTLGDAVDAVPTTARIYPFYAALLGPTIDAVNLVDISQQRNRGDVVLDLGRRLPFDLAVTYTRDEKTGYRGASGGDILGVVTSAIDVPESIDEVTQDFGVRWAWNFPKKGNVHASFNRNLYNDRLNSLTVDNPFRAADLAYVSTAVPGGPAQARFSTSPDNEATRGAFGAQFRFARRTLLTADAAFGSWTQNEAFLPYTINSAIFTPSGAAANQVSALQHQSLDGKIDTTNYNLTFASRPVDALAVRLRYRNYAYKDKTNRWVITGDTSGSPDRSWGAANAPTADEPYGHATANRTDSSTGHFEGQVGYDIGDLTLEGVYRNIQTSWEGRASSSGTDGSENGYTLAAMYHSRDWLGFRFHFDGNKRKVSGVEAGSIGANQGLMADHAERDQTRVGLDIEVTPSDKYGVTFAYNRRNDDYPNRPFEVAGNSETESGLLESSYDMFSVDFDCAPTDRVTFNAFYSYEKAAQTNQWVTLTSGALNNRQRFEPSDKGNTFGVNGVFRLDPEKWTLSILAQQQKVDGFWDITAREAGSFYNPGRTTLIPTGQGAAADVADYDDFTWTNAVVDLGYALSKSWKLSLGYAYDKYKTADAFSDGTTILPQSVLFFMKANDNGYTANMAYTRLSYRF